MAPWDWSAESMVPGRDEVFPPPPPELPAYEEWEDVNDAETALYQWPWGQAPPIDENLPALGLEDASNQIEDEEELFSFSADPPIADAEFAFIQPYDASEQQEEDEEQDADQTGPVGPAFVSIMAATLVDDAASQQDEDEFLEADQTSPLSSNEEVGAGIYYDADEQYEEDEYLEADQASPLAADVASPMAASLVEDARDQPEDVIEEPIGVSYDPLPADRVLPVITIDSHDGSKKKKKRLPDETEHEYRLRNATRRSSVENAVSPPEPEPQAEEIASIKPAKVKIFAPPEKMAIIRTYSDAEIEADDQEVMDLVRKLDEEMLAILLKRL